MYHLSFEIECMSLTQDEVQHIARLARIGLTEEEVEKFQKDLASIFGLIEELEEANGGEDTSVDGREINRTREDVAKVTDNPADMVNNFPLAKDGFNKVRSVF